MTTKIRLLHDTVGIPTGAVAVTQSASDNTTKVATTAYVTTALANLADSAPSTLNTLNELAAALGDDANFSTTVTNSIAAKLPLAGGSLTGSLDISGGTVNGTSFADNRLLRLQNTSTTDGSRMGIAFQGNSSVGSGLAWIEGVNYDQSIGATDIRFSTYSGSAWNGDMMTLSNNGKVGIGITSPTTKLEILDANSVGLRFGDIASTPSSQTAGYIGMSTSAYSGNNGDLVLIPRTSATSNILLMEGNVGIGMTPAPVGSDTVLSIYNSATPRIKLHNNTTGSASGDGGEINMSGNIMILENRENAEMRFYTNGAERIQISNNGNLEFKSTTSSFTGASSFTNHTNGYLYLRGGTSGLRLDDDSSVNTIQIVDGSSGYIKFETGDGSERMRIDSSGKIGIGTTSPNAPLEVSGGVGMSGGWGRSLLLRHVFPVMVFQSEYSTDAYGAIGYDNSTGMHFMVNSPSIDVFSSSQTSALYIRDDKRIGVGTTSVDGGKLVISGEGGSSSATLNLATATSTTFNHAINAFNANLTSGENNLFVIGRAGSTRNSAWMGYKWYSDASYSNCLTFGHWGNNNIVNLSAYGILMAGGLETAPNYPGAITTARTGSSSTTTQATWGFNATAGGSNKDFGYKAAGAGSYAYGVLNAAETAWMSRLDFSGAIHLTNTTVQSISDRRLKKDIVDANSQWDDIKALQFKNFKWIDEAKGTDTYLGLIADEVESVSPGLVGTDAVSAETMPEDGIDPEYKNVKYSMVWMKAVKALQEAMTKIETLETKLEAAEARIATLEG